MGTDRLPDEHREGEWGRSAAVQREATHDEKSAVRLPRRGDAPRRHIHLLILGSEKDIEVQVFSEEGEAQGTAPLGIVLSQGWVHKAVSLMAVGPGGLILHEAMRELSWELPVERLGPGDDFESAAQRIASKECGDAASTMPLEPVAAGNRLGAAASDVHIVEQDGTVDDHRVTQVWCCERNSSHPPKGSGGRLFGLRTLTELLSLHHGQAGALDSSTHENVQKLINKARGATKSVGSNQAMSCIDLLELEGMVTIIQARNNPRVVSKSIAQLDTVTHNRLIERILVQQLRNENK